MHIHIANNKILLGEEAASIGAHFIRQAIQKKGKAVIILATGASQFEMLSALVKEELDWSVVSCFHLDEYIGMSETHPASFRKYLKERFADKVPVQAFHFINGEADPGEECLRLNQLIGSQSIDVAFIGIGENGHLAFNDPPADFETEKPFIVVELDEACRKQQLGEGWFPDLEAVPTRAISMSIHQILKSKTIICTVPDQRKAQAVTNAVRGEISPDIPASALQRHRNTFLFLDRESSSLLR